MQAMNHRAYKFRFYPTDEQVKLLAQTFGCVRFVYNYILDWRQKQFLAQKQNTTYVHASAKLTAIKKEFTFLNDVSSVPLQQSLRHQQAAFKNFFEKRAKYPMFKKKHDKQSAEFTKSGFKYDNGKLYLAKCKEPLNIKFHRDLPSKPSTITVSMDCAGRYFVSCLCEFEPTPLPISPNSIGLDGGITHLIVSDKGEKFNNIRTFNKYQLKLKKAQRVLSKKPKGSKNRVKARLKVAKIHRKIADTRMDNLHKLSRKIINENQIICVESLQIKNMVKNKKLAKHIADCSWGELVRQLEYKAKWANRQLVKIDRFYPSTKLCSSCGHKNTHIDLSVRAWKCPNCHAIHDRDINAAKNILTAGLAELAFGVTVRPS